MVLDPSCEGRWPSDKVTRPGGRATNFPRPEENPPATGENPSPVTDHVQTEVESNLPRLFSPARLLYEIVRCANLDPTRRPKQPAPEKNPWEK